MSRYVKPYLNNFDIVAVGGIHGGPDAVFADNLDAFWSTSFRYDGRLMFVRLTFSKVA